jgi:hypothetical protein
MSLENLAQESSLWEAADQLRANSKLTSSEYCMPVLGVIFSHDVLTCDKCGGRREVRAFVSSPALARKALEALGVPFEPLKIAKGHDPPSQESLDFGPGIDGIDPSYPD